MTWDIHAAKALASRAVESAGYAQRVRHGVRVFARRLRAEAEACATEALFNWAARAVEWYGAHRAWVFLKDPGRDVLYSVPGAAVRTADRRPEISIECPNSIVAQVWKSGEEYLSNNVWRDQSAGKPYWVLDNRTGAELAVPIFDYRSGDGRPIGVFNLEADSKGAFTTSQARELRRKAALFAYPALALQSLRSPDPSGLSWGWYPEVHGWNPGRVLERFCHAVVTHLDREPASAPSCTIWYRDPESDRCWALATCGYDYEFLNLYALGPLSAVARTAAGGRIQRGTPDELGFAAPTKARRHNVRQAVLAPLHTAAGPGAPFRGALAVYAFDDDAPLPTDGTVRWLARRAEELIATLYDRRDRFAGAFILSRLGKSAFINPGFRLFGKALSTVLPNDAVSLYARGAGGATLVRVDKAGLEAGKRGQAEKLPIVSGGQQETITAHCAVRADRDWRINFGDADPIYQSGDPPPKPHPMSFERLEVGDAEHHRRLGVGVPAAPESGDHAIGVIRIYRSSGLSHPFTHMDASLVRQLAGSYHSCQFLFAGRRLSPDEQKLGPFVVGPTPSLLVAVLRRASDAFADRKRFVRQAAVVEHCADADPPYRRFAYYSPTSQLPPDEHLQPLLQDPAALAALSGDACLTVRPITFPDGQGGERVCVPLTAWSGRYPVNVLCLLDFARPALWDADDRLRVVRLGVEAAAMLAANRWTTPPQACDDDTQPLPTAFVQYIRRLTAAGVVGADVLPAHDGLPEPARDWQTAGEPTLAAYGVRVRAGGGRCAIPLRMGPFQVAVAVCDVSDELAGLLRQSGRQRGAGKSYLKIHVLVGMITGAWCRVVAPNTALWSVTFRDEWHSPGEGGVRWLQTIKGPTATELTAGRLADPLVPSQSPPSPRQHDEYGGEGG